MYDVPLYYYKRLSRNMVTNTGECPELWWFIRIERNNDMEPRELEILSSITQIVGSTLSQEEVELYTVNTTVDVFAPRKSGIVTEASMRNVREKLNNELGTDVESTQISIFTHEEKKKEVQRAYK
jgi:hypothetical protein